MINLRERIRALCEEKNLPLQNLATYIGMSLTNLYRCFKNNSMQLRDLEKISEIFSISIIQLLQESMEDDSVVTITNNGNKGNILINSKLDMYRHTQMDIVNKEKEIQYLNQVTMNKEKEIEYLKTMIGNKEQVISGKDEMILMLKEQIERIRKDIKRAPEALNP